MLGAINGDELFNDRETWTSVGWYGEEPKWPILSLKRISV